MVQERACVVNRIQKLLEGATIKLSSVASEIMGVSARAKLEEIAAGKTGAALMAGLARGRMRSKIPELQKALTGLVQPHHHFLPAQQLGHVDFPDELIETINATIGCHIEGTSWPDEPAEPGTAADTEEGTPMTDKPGLPLSWEAAMGLLDTIPGVDQRIAEVILAEANGPA